MGVVGHFSDSTLVVRFALCVSENVDGAPLASFFVEGNAPATTVLKNPERTVLPAAASMVAASSGTFRFGFCIENLSNSTDLALNDNVNGWFMVSN